MLIPRKEQLENSIKEYEAMKWTKRPEYAEFKKELEEYE